MAVMEGPVRCHHFMRANHFRVSAAPFRTLMSTQHLGSRFWGSVLTCRSIVRYGTYGCHPVVRKNDVVRHAFSSSDGNGSKAGNFSENDEDYVNSSVMEAVELRRASDGCYIRMRDGRNMRCVHNIPQGGILANDAPHPVIVLKMEDGSDLLLPILVVEMQSVILMTAIRNIQGERPTIDQVVKEMIDKMGYRIQLVRVTRRVQDAYLAQMYLSKVGNENETISFDLRPSDAISMAVRSKVPIQVNRNLAYSEGMRVIEAPKVNVQSGRNNGILFTELDRPDGQFCSESKEFEFVSNMLTAAMEERYEDAATWREKLKRFRANGNNWK